MKITFSWLQDFLQTNATVQEVADKLSMLGLVVDAIHNPGEELKDFTVVEILSAEKHPDADKLKVCQVNIGGEALQVVCGAPNARAGMKAVFAKSGVTIPSTGVTLKSAEIRGVKSNGMMCSSRELGLGEDCDGIIEVPDHVKVGTVYCESLGLNDPVFDIDITPNRGDCLGAFGLARDLAASGIGALKPFKFPSVAGTYKCPISINIATDACPVFSGRLIKNVKNCESPDWLQNRLRAIGARPISALVDITNYINTAFGRPMHVFDADKLSGGITIRAAKNGEKIIALDEKTYELNNTMNVVADDNFAVSIAGIIGGLESGCTMETTNVFIECAVFDAINITLTGRNLNIITDARHRFERGVDGAIVQDAIEFATQFIIEHCGGEPSEILTAGSNPIKMPIIEFNPAMTLRMTGVEVSNNEAKEILTKLGFEVTGSDTWKVQVPTWRHDMKIPMDLVEEIIRIYGYDHIPVSSLPYKKSSAADEVEKIKLCRPWTLRRALATRGLDEALTWSFLKREDSTLFGGGTEELRLVNPISQDLSDMRTSLLPNLINATQKNHDRGYPNIKLFEIGSQYNGVEPDQQPKVVAGVRSGMFVEKHWLDKSRPVDIFDVKADALAALEACGVELSKLSIISEAPNWYHPGRSGTLCLGPKNKLAYFGEIHPYVLSSMGVDQNVVGFEIFVENIPVAKKKNVKPLSVSQHQPLTRDFAFIVHQDVKAADLMNSVYKAAKDLITDTKIFDVYQGKGITDNHKSIALSVILQPDKTLTDIEIKQVSDSIIDAVKAATGGELRS